MDRDLFKRGIGEGIVIGSPFCIGSFLMRNAYPDLVRSIGAAALGLLLGALFALMIWVEKEKYRDKTPVEINNRVGGYHLAYGCVSGVMMGFLTNGSIWGDCESSIGTNLVMGVFLSVVMFSGAMLDLVVDPTEIKLDIGSTGIKLAGRSNVTFRAIWLVLFIGLYSILGSIFASNSKAAFGISVLVFRVVFSIAVSGILARKPDKFLIEELHGRMLGFSIVMVPLLSFIYVR